MLLKPLNDRDNDDIRHIASVLDKTDLIKKYSKDSLIDSKTMAKIKYNCSKNLEFIEIQENQKLFIEGISNLLIKGILQTDYILY